MENSTKHKRLRKWMLNQLETESCRGVVWIDKSQGIFKIPWYHINKIKATEVAEKFKIFIEWAKFTQKYKEGEKADYSKFKTQLRTALTKLNDFVELPKKDDVCDSEVEPCRLFQFTEWSPPSRGMVSPDSTVLCEGEFPKHTQTQAQRQLFQDEVCNVPIFLQHQGTNLQAQTPENVSYYPLTHTNNIHGIEDLNNADINQEQHVVLPPKIPKMIEDQSYARDPLWTRYSADIQQGNLQNESHDQIGFDILHEAMNQSEIAGNLASENYPDNQLKEKPLERDPSVNEYMQTSDVVHEAEDFKDLMRFWEEDNSQTNPDTFFAEAEKCKPALPQDLAAIPWTDLVPNQPPVDLGIIQQCGGTHSHQKDEYISDVNHQMSIVFSLGKPKTQVMDKTVGAKGCRLFFDHNVFDTGCIVYQNMYGSENLEQLQLPSLDCYPRESETTKKKMSQILESMTRGLLLTFQDGDIYADRKCRCKIFAYDADCNAKLIKRTENCSDPQKVFDYKKFKEDLGKGIRRDPFFILTFGQAITAQDLIGDKIWVYAYVYHKEAQKISQDHNQGRSSLSSLEPTLSDFNSLDKLEQRFRDMSTK
ncbi:hypothetical protein EGW08_019983 [Elysia chlorotica]|uniref:IRF tryptophan pentad repeat domain-containing protein n=1 Tax=Elysia chlorotica TaxID=188477 RepID=A0A433SSL9_ELYCH|nr:hypothetical protein EGW08_019983 [Elysia chlorotica]